MTSLHQEKFKIRGNETGPTLNVTLPSVAGLLQEAAWLHSMELKVSLYELLKKGLTWVLSRLIIEMDGFVKHNDVLTVTTWPSGVERHNIFRDYHLKDKNSTLIGKAKSVWVIMDLKSRQVIPPPSFITDINLQNIVPHVVFNTDKIPAVESYAHSKSFIANWYDIDINRHVNHISFIKWVTESAPIEILKHKEATAIDIVFRAESEFGDEILSYSQPVGGQPLLFLHKLTQKHSGRELTLAKTMWK